MEWQTLFRGVNLLPGGSNWRTEQAPNGGKDVISFLKTGRHKPTLTQDEFDSAFDSTFRRILKRYVGKGAGLGISLTGGLDTRMIMACRPETKVRPICYTFSGRTEHTLDASIAARIASECGLEHRVLRITDDFLRSYRDLSIGPFLPPTVAPAQRGRTRYTSINSLANSRPSASRATLEARFCAACQHSSRCGSLKDCSRARSAAPLPRLRSIFQRQRHIRSHSPLFMKSRGTFSGISPRVVHRSLSALLILITNWSLLLFRRVPHSAFRRYLL